MTESRGVVGPAGAQTSDFDWEPSGLHPNLHIMSDHIRSTLDLCPQSIPSQPLLGTWLCTNDKKNSGRKVGLWTTYSLVGATAQVAVPPHAQSVLVMVHSD
jgi:hypothetical protein